jgi:hypothetical protein
MTTIDDGIGRIFDFDVRMLDRTSDDVVSSPKFLGWPGNPSPNPYPPNFKVQT